MSRGGSRQGFERAVLQAGVDPTEIPAIAELRRQRRRERRASPRCQKCFAGYPVDEMVWMPHTDERYCSGCWRHIFSDPARDMQARARELDSYYRSKYGIGFREYGDLHLLQHGVCAVCRTVAEKPLVVDHNHETGAVRGLLCAQCNSGLGMFKDSVSSLAGAIQYLSRNAEREDQPDVAS